MRGIETRWRCMLSALAHVRFADTEGLMTSDRRPAGSRPPAIPPGQEYYWTDEWQAGELETLADVLLDGELETLAELQAGGGHRFESADEALRFLFQANSASRRAQHRR